MKGRNTYRVLLVAVVLWSAASPFIWRQNMEAAFGSLPWSISSIPLAVATLALICLVPLWQLRWRWAVAAVALAVLLVAAALFGPAAFGDGSVFNAALLALVAAAPAIMHSNNAFKRRRAKTHAP